MDSRYCNVFHRCVSGTRRDFRCPRATNTPYDLWWNQQTQQCDWPCKSLLRSLHRALKLFFRPQSMHWRCFWNIQLSPRSSHGKRPALQQRMRWLSSASRSQQCTDSGGEQSSGDLLVQRARNRNPPSIVEQTDRQSRSELRLYPRGQILHSTLLQRVSRMYGDRSGTGSNLRMCR